MPSSFTWLDYSEHHRQRMMDVIDLFAEQATRDELGIGTVRDAFSDLLFPGISVIQTRARYFFFVPWMYLELERRRVPSSKVAQAGRQQETKLINVLVHADPAGAIGRRARERLKRLPSDVYWQGLAHLGIRRFPGNRDAYHRSFDAYHEKCDAYSSDRSEQDDGLDEAPPHNWHADLPGPPPDFPAQADFHLRSVEADYLRERILTTARGTLLAFLVDHGRSWEPTGFPWEHPQAAEFPVTPREQIHHARNFSETINGAALLYNLLLAEKAENQDRCEEYRTRLQDWATDLRERSADLEAWDRGEFWRIVAAGNARIPIPTRQFIKDWLDLVLTPRLSALADLPEARRLIQMRERQLKKELARLDNQRALELWNGDAGTAQIDFRWRTAQTIIGDILEGLNEGPADA